MTSRRCILTLTTDFGTADPFVGIMKGVILGINPDAIVVDLTHEVPPQDIGTAAFHLSNSWHRFPRGTIHLAVVDPGVGSGRRTLALAAEGHLFLAPDNGLLSPVLAASPSWRAVEITVAHYMAPTVSRTFHGRDLFASAAAHLARGVAIENLGDPVTDPVRLPEKNPQVHGTTVTTEIVHVDRFGNAALGVTEGLLRSLAGDLSGVGIEAETAGSRIDRFVTHYAESAGRTCILVNSDGRLEIAAPGGSAAALLGLSRGTEVVLRLTRRQEGA